MANAPQEGPPPAQGKYEWVMLEHTNAKGEPILPQKLIESTWMTTHEARAKGTVEGIRIRTGFRPKPILMISNKLYQVDKFIFGGWRRRVEVSVDVEMFRVHEREWFRRMKGMKAEVEDSGTPGTLSEKFLTVVKERGFERKRKEIYGEKGEVTKAEGYEGKLVLRETFWSVLKREWISYVSNTVGIVITAAVSAIIIALITIWLTGERGGAKIDSKGTPVQEGSLPVDASETVSGETDNDENQGASNPEHDMTDTSD